MSTQTTDYLDLVERLPEGALLRLQNVGWDDYEHLLSQMNALPGHRVTYDRGRLFIMSPNREHEFYKELISGLARVLADELDVIVEGGGATTLKSKLLKKGAEPDTCFYVQNASRVIGKLTFDLLTDPPPDVVIEIDMTSDSLDKFHVYAALGVPEIWRYDGERMKFYRLVGEGYQTIEHSLAFPSLAAEDLARFVELSKTEGQTAALKAFRAELRRARPR